MNSIIHMISLIEKRPAMYITRNSISCLKAFIDGWGLRDHDTISDSESMGLFQEWIEKKYNIATSHSWCDIILFYSQDECQALQSFFKLFNEWKEESGRDW